MGQPEILILSHFVHKDRHLDNLTHCSVPEFLYHPMVRLSHAHHYVCTVKYEHLRQRNWRPFPQRGQVISTVLALNYANCLLLAPSLTQGSSYKYYPLRSDERPIFLKMCAD